jgi:hypothetical protein
LVHCLPIENRRGILIRGGVRILIFIHARLSLL